MSIFDEQVSRKPDFYPWTEQFLEAAQSNLWTHREFTFQSDIQDFKVNMTKEEQDMIIRSLSCIGQLEISVKKFWAKLGDNLPHPSLYDLGYMFAYQEIIHSSSYERLLEVLGIEDAFDQVLEMPILKGRVNYLKKYLHKFHSDNRKQFIYSIILFTVFVENIALFSQFYTCMWFKKYKNYLKDTEKQTEYSSREENLHHDGGCRIINEIHSEHPELFDDELKDRVVEESQNAVEYEFKIIDWILGDFYHEYLNKELLYNFIKNRLNNSLVKIGYDPMFEIDQELLKKTHWFTEQIEGNNQQDFFDNRPTEYSKLSQSFDEASLF
jgi:ribonucleoside-diphosphate reductase beta chain